MISVRSGKTVEIMHEERLIDAGGFSASLDCHTILRHIEQTIKALPGPSGSGSFTLYDQAWKARDQGNGVTPIKGALMLQLKSLGWNLETSVKIATLRNPGKLDANTRWATAYYRCYTQSK